MATPWDTFNGPLYVMKTQVLTCITAKKFHAQNDSDMSSEKIRINFALALMQKRWKNQSQTVTQKNFI